MVFSKLVVADKLAAAAAQVVWQPLLPGLMLGKLMKNKTTLRIFYFPYIEEMGATFN